MPRKSEQTLEFWQFETGLFDDGKIIDLGDRYGPVGEAIYFRILSYIAQSNGYYACFDDNLVLYVYRSIGGKWLKGRKFVKEVIFYCAECGLFDVSLLQSKIISSRGIQRRWLYAKKKSRARGFSTAEFWLLDGEEPNEPRHGVPCSDENKCSNNPDYCSNNPDKCSNNPLYKEKKSKDPPKPPKKGGHESGGEAKERFLSAYPKFRSTATEEYDYIDYSLLLKEFGKSKRLQGWYSMRLVSENYDAIRAGAYRDKGTDEEERIERERYYSVLRAKAEREADWNEELAMSDPEYKSVHCQLSDLNLSISMAEIRHDEKERAALIQKQQRLERQRVSILARMGMTPEDLKPRYHCKKCNDTGFLPDGRACGCYKLGNWWEKKTEP